MTWYCPVYRQYGHYGMGKECRHCRNQEAKG